ncbi:hypothetical protein AB0L06_18760 [Spirillospora sp. NPDC052269]
MRIIAAVLLGLTVLLGLVDVPAHASAYPCSYFDRFSGQWRPSGCSPWQARGHPARESGFVGVRGSGPHE